MFTNESLMTTCRSRRHYNRSAWGRQRVSVAKTAPVSLVEPLTHITEMDVPRDGDQALCGTCGQHYPQGEMFRHESGWICYPCKIDQDQEWADTMSAIKREEHARV